MLANKVKFNPLFFPFSIFYGIGVGVRNKLFDWGILPTERFPIPVICVGNLAVGGTGKTPHTEYLVELLKDKYKVAVLSRGYKRKTKGFILADSSCTSEDIGDEPYQIYYKYPDIIVAVDSDRRKGIRELLSLDKDKKPDVILLDDGFQHRYVTPSFSIILTDYARPFYLDKLMPYGRLREPRFATSRTDAVIMTKCNCDMKPLDYRLVEKSMRLSAHQSLFFTTIDYKEIKPVFPEEAEPWSLADIRKSDAVFAVTGVASPKTFIKEIKRYTNNIEKLSFKDHHHFSKQDLADIENKFNKIPSLGKLIIMTEKDAARLRNNNGLPESLRKVMYYMPISIKFCTQSENEFKEMINKHVSLFC